MTGDQLAAWRQARADYHKRQRQQRGRKRATPGYRPGMARIQPPDQDNGQHDPAAALARGTAPPAQRSMQRRERS